MTRQSPNIFAKIKVVGVGGAGGSAINRMLKAKSQIVKYVAINTDGQALQMIKDKTVKKVRIGRTLTKGSGTGMDPEIGRAAVEEDIAIVKDSLKGADMIFITAGLGGGTSSGAGPVIAELCQQTKALTIAILTKPFAFEGARRMAIAEEGLKKFAHRTDVTIIISNDQILKIMDKSTSVLKAFTEVDKILQQGVQAMVESLSTTGLINVDLFDIKTVLKGAGTTLLGVGHASGEKRAEKAAQEALKSPFTEGLSIKGASSTLFIINGPSDLKITEVDEIGRIITKGVDKNAKIIFGTVIDKNLKDEIKVTLIATGFDRPEENKESINIAQTSISRPVYSSLPDEPVDIDDREDNQKTNSQKKSTASKKPFRLSKDLADKVKTYGINIVNNNSEIKEENIEDIQLEEELEIPTFLRKKLK